jgi:acid phosphatase (class A)
MKPEAGVYAVMALLLATACAVSPEQPTAPSTPAAMQGAETPRDPAAGNAPRTLGFLTAATTPDAYAIIPPAPKEGEARNTADWSIFRATRALEGSDRWRLAVNDDSYLPADLLRDFSCSVGATLTPQNAPTVAMILARVGTDAGNAAARAKDIYRRTRPFLHNPGNICIERGQGITASFDYPSGHSSASWVEGLALAELVPDRSTQILQRARAYGESRIVCGVHNYSAVEAGRTNGAAVFAALHGSEEFRTAMARAREELDTARRNGPHPDAAQCAAEAELTKPLPVQ